MLNTKIVENTQNVNGIHVHLAITWLLGATENERPDIARPSKLWRLTSQDWTTRHHIARVDIARVVSLCE